MKLRLHPGLSAAVAVIATLSIPTSATAVSAPKLGSRCAADRWGKPVGSSVCVRTGKTTYLLGQLPAEPPIASTSATLSRPPKLGGQCKPTEWGRVLGPYVCTRTGRFRYVAALLLVTPPKPPLPLAAITPSSATPQIETTLPAPQTTVAVESTTAVPATTAPPPPPSTASPPPPARRFANCTELNAVFPHGVARTGGSDRTSGKPVTTFTVDDAVYEANKGSDRDGDGVACEKA